jgi:hypothetical protein
MGLDLDVPAVPKMTIIVDGTSDAELLVPDDDVENPELSIVIPALNED